MTPKESHCDQSYICTCGVLLGGKRDPRPDCPIHEREDEAHWLKVALASMRNLPETTEDRSRMRPFELFGDGEVEVLLLALTGRYMPSREHAAILRTLQDMAQYEIGWRRADEDSRS